MRGQASSHGTLERWIVALAAVCVLTGCEAVREWQCSAKVNSVREAWYGGAIAGALSWLLLWRGWLRAALLFGASAAWILGYGAADVGKCGEILAHHWLWTTGGVVAFCVPAALGLILPRLRHWQEAREARQRGVAEDRRKEQERLSQERERAEREAEERQRAQEAARQAEKERAEYEARKAASKAERERLAAVKALAAHIDVITSAARSVRPDGDNVVLINTIDAELKAISRNGVIDATMLGNAEVQEEVRLIVRMLAEKGVSDPLLLNRLKKIFDLPDSGSRGGATLPE